MSNILAENKINVVVLFQIFEGGYHNLLFEPDGMDEECMDLITKWIAERL